MDENFQEFLDKKLDCWPASKIVNVLMSQIPHVAYLCLDDDAYTMLWLSSDVQKLLGYPASDFIGTSDRPSARNFVELYHEKDYERLIRNPVNEAVAVNGNFDIKYRIKTKWGHYQAVREIGRAVELPQVGKLLQGTIVEQDVWQEKDLCLDSLKEQVDIVTLVAPTRLSMLVLGETGVGKEVIAQKCHDLSRRHGRFVALNCAALTDSLWASELFGHEEGSFTGAKSTRAGVFEQADGGTLFLDEVADLSAEQQGALLRVLAEGQVTRLGSNDATRVDVRVLTATCKDIGDEVRDGRFRPDLYHRIAQTVVEIPPLRDRTQDILAIANNCIDSFVGSESERPQLSELDKERLIKSQWPGNIRQLKSLINAALALSDNDGILDLGRAIAMQEIVKIGARSVKAPADWSLANALRPHERRHIERLLAHVSGNQKKAAELANVGYRAFRDKVRNLGIDPEQFKAS